MLLKIVKFQNFSPLVLHNRRYLPVAKHYLFRFSSDKQDPPSKNGKVIKPQDKSQFIQVKKPTTFNVQKNIHTQYEDKLNKVISQAERKQLQNDIKLLKIENEKNATILKIENEKIATISKIENEKIVTVMKAQIEVKLLQKDLQMATKINQMATKEKQKIEKEKLNRQKDNIWIAIISVIGTLFVAGVTYIGTKWTNTTQEKSINVQEVAAGIYTKQKVEELLIKCSTTPLTVPSYYVPIQKLENEAYSYLKYFDKIRHKEHEVDFFHFLKGFPGYGKTTTFANCINKLRAQEKKQNQGYKRKIYYIDLKVEGNQSDKKVKQAQEQRFNELLILMRNVAKMQTEEKKYITIVIDDINRLEVKSQKQLESVYFSQIWTLSAKHHVNMICISSSDYFSKKIAGISYYRKYCNKRELYLPTNEQKKKIFKACLVHYADGKKIPEYVQNYFLENYSSIKNLNNVIKNIDNYLLFSDNKIKWLEFIKNQEQPEVLARLEDIKNKLNLLSKKYGQEKCSSVIRFLLKDYKLQKTLRNRQLKQFYPQFQKLNEVIRDSVLDVLSEAHVLCYNQIVSQIDKLALEQYCNSSHQTSQEKSANV